MKLSEVTRLSKYVTDCGGEVLPGTNEYELLRFRTAIGTGIVYTNARKSRITLTGEAERCYDAMKSGKPARLGGKRKVRHVSDQRLESAGQAQGWRCIYCDLIVKAEDCTAEHFLSMQHGGTNHVANIVMACGHCNAIANNKSVFDKLRMRDAMRDALVQIKELPR